MKRRELLDLIEEGENIQCEFKRQFTTPEKIAREMIAFANTKGGFIIFGVDDDREVVGVDSEKSESELIIDAVENYCEPPLKYSIDFIEVFGKETVVVEIPESDNKPHRLQDYKNDFDINKAVVMVRVNDKGIQASKEMVRILKANSANLALKKYTIGQVERMVFEYLSRLRKNFRKRIK